MRRSRTSVCYPLQDRPFQRIGATNLRIAHMRAELDTKLTLRHRVVAGMEQSIAARKVRLQRLWASRRAHQLSQLAKGGSRVSPKSR